VRKLRLCGILLCICSAAWAGDDATQAATQEPAINVPVSAGEPQDPSPERWSIHYQATSIGQTHGSFPSLYQGLRSLPAQRENRVSLTATLFLTYRWNDHFEFVVNPEIAGGKGLGDVAGVAGFVNGEIPRVAAATPSLYLARGYVRGTFALGSATEPVEGEANQAAGRRPVRRYTAIVGKFGLSDFFDDNTYSHDPRTQFINWSIMYNGAWDYPADVRGYTVGVVQEIAMRTWAVRAAVTTEPSMANGPDLDFRVTKNRGVVAEYEQRWAAGTHPGALRVLGYLNREAGGTFRLTEDQPGIPVLDPTRRNGAKKYGFGLNAEQQLGEYLGAFGRYGWSDGKTESWAFTQIDRSLSGGVSVKGALWKRRLDQVGLAAARNQLSGDQRSFLARGGTGFIVGDGRLNYQPEKIVEAYYCWNPVKTLALTLDYQRVVDPAYNRDRGPVRVYSLRVHLER
jgi:high affinity Mn2+ porin